MISGNRNRMWRAAGGLAMALLAAPPAFGNALVDEGRALATNNCARCHAVGRTGASPMNEAPPFRHLHERYAVEMLEEALAEGIVVNHPDMPRFELAPPQIDALIAYLKSLER